MAAQVLFLVEVLLAAFVLWLGLYSITRDLPWRHETERLWQRPPLLAGAGLILGSIYLFGSAMKGVSTLPAEFIRWQQLTLWGIPIAIVCFFLAVTHLTCSGRESPHWVRVLVPVSVGAAIFLAAIILTGYPYDHDGIRAGDTALQPYYLPLRVRVGDLYYGYIVVGIVGTIAVLVHRLPSTIGDAGRRSKFLVGIAAGACLLAGLMATAYLSWLSHPYLPMQLGDFLAAMGAVAVSYDIARHNALKHERIIESDFWHSLIGVGGTVLICLVVYLGFSALFAYPVQPLTVVLISIFVVLTQTPYNWGGAVLDRLLLPRWVVGYREQLMLMRQLPLMSAHPSRTLAEAGETFDAVLRATRMRELEALIQHEVDEIFKYKNYDSDQLLSESRLLDLKIAQAALDEYASERNITAKDLTDFQRAECLRCLLRCAITEWSWSPAPTTRQAHIEKIILNKKYVEQRSRVDVERLLSEQFDEIITGGGYSRRLKDARGHLARELHERELANTPPA